MASVIPPPVSGTLAGALLRGIFWSVGLRWGLRLIGLVSTLVVARLLMPADYGLVAMAALVMSLVQTFLDADASTALLRTPDATKEFADSAWTMTLLQSLVVAAAIAAVAPFAADYFHEPRLTHVIWAYTFTIVAGGLASVGPLLAKKTLDYSLEVKVLLIGRVASFVATVGLAFAWRDYWALVVGSIAGAVVGLVAGYLAHPYRPRWTLVHGRELLGFSQWMLLSGIGVFSARKLDGFVVGRVGSASDLGSYNIAMELGQMLTTELGAPLSRALLPVLSTMHAEPARMRSAVMRTTGAMNTLTLPAGVGLALVAHAAVPVLLGPSWTEAVPFLVLFSLIGAVRYVTGPYFALFMAVGRSRALAAMSWLEFGTFAVCAALFWSDGVVGIVHARVVSTIVIVATWVILGHVNGLRATELVRATWRPVVACTCMAAAVTVVSSAALQPAAALVVEIAVGAVAYVAVLGGLWLASGRPDGIEARALERVAALVAIRRPA